jgi:hypothetical protein
MRDQIVLIEVANLGFSVLEIIHQDGTEVCVVTHGTTGRSAAGGNLAGRTIVDDGEMVLDS